MSNWSLALDGRHEALGVGTGDGTTHTAGNAAKAAGYTTIGTTGFAYTGFWLYVTSNNNARYRIDVAVGASDNIIVEDLFLDAMGTGSNTGHSRWWIPIPVPASTAIKVRAHAQAASQSLRVIVVGYQTDFRGFMRARKIVPLHGWSGSTPFVDPLPSHTEPASTAESGYTEITSSTSVRAMGLYMAMGTGGDTTRTAGRRIVRLYRGASLSERLIWVSQIGNGTTTLLSNPEGPWPIAVPSGQRLAFTTQSHASPPGAEPIHMALHALIP